MNHILDDIDQLPSLPASILQITAMLSSGNSDVRAIEQIVRHDEALSMTILRYANSAQFGMPGRMFDLRQGIVRLGGNALMRIVLQQKVAAVFDRGSAAFGVGRGAMWRSSLGGAIATEWMGQRTARPETNLSFLCALLRDIGKLALDAAYGRHYISMVAEHMLPHRSFVQAERDALGFDHAELGGELALRWGLPNRISDAIRFHHEPPAADEPTHDDLFDIVHGADTVTLWAGLSLGIDGVQYHLAPHVRQQLCLERHSAEPDIAQVWKRLHEIDTMMNGSAAGGTQNERHVA